MTQRIYTHDEVYAIFDVLEQMAPSYDSPKDAAKDPAFMTFFDELRNRILHCEPNLDEEHFRLFTLMALHLTICKGKAQ